MFTEHVDKCYRRLGLRTNPFLSTPDTQFFYPSIQHVKALKHMQYGAINASISLITGAIGTGKTLLCRTFLKEIKDEMASAYIFNPLQNEQDLLRNIHHDLGGRDTRQHSVGEWYKSINRSMAASAARLYQHRQQG